MRWFQVDSDTPHDPRVLNVIIAMGNDGLGGLFRIWCHIANHGEKKPGYSLNTSGRPMPRAELVYASGLSDPHFDQLIQICVENGHFLRCEWERRKVIAIPAMSSRADTYTKRRVRTKFEVSSKFVPLQDSTRQDSTKNPPTPLADAKGGVRLTRQLRKRAEEIRRIRFGECKHDPTCQSVEACLVAIAAELRAKSA